jgi:hypothetical protein
MRLASKIVARGRSCFALMFARVVADDRALRVRDLTGPPPTGNSSREDACGVRRLQWAKANEEAPLGDSDRRLTDGQPSASREASDEEIRRRDEAEALMVIPESQPLPGTHHRRRPVAQTHAEALPPAVDG